MIVIYMAIIIIHLVIDKN